MGGVGNKGEEIEGAETSRLIATRQLGRGGSGYGGGGGGGGVGRK